MINIDQIYLNLRAWVRRRVKKLFPVFYIKLEIYLLRRKAGNKIFMNRRIIGEVDHASTAAIQGWAFDLKKKSEPIYVDLYMDGKLFVSTKTSYYRPDVNKRYGGHSYSGFYFELPQSTDNDIPVEFEVRARIPSQNIVSAQIAFKRPKYIIQNQRRFAIKLTARNKECGDYYFAVGIKRALTRLGHAVRIDRLDQWFGIKSALTRLGHAVRIDRPCQWEKEDALGDDVVIVLRGLSAYITKSYQINLMWNISHPDLITDNEYESYDHVFVASQIHTKMLANRLNVPVSPLLQCTDPEIFNPDVRTQESHEVIFVGNTRNIYRRVVQDALLAGLPLSVFGRGWKKFVTSQNLKGKHIPNSDLAGYYVSAGVVLNDHWCDMQQKGFISNRLFDAAACGARIVTDNIDGLEQIFGDSIITYEIPEDLKNAVKRLQRESCADRQKRLTLAKKIMREDTFDARVKDILDIVNKLEKTKLNISRV